MEGNSGHTECPVLIVFSHYQFPGWNITTRLELELDGLVSQVSIVLWSDKWKIQWMGKLETAQQTNR